MDPHRASLVLLGAAIGHVILTTGPASAQDCSDPILTYTDETATRLVAPAARGVDDQEEKDFAFGDVDGDGDVDLVVARKQPFTTAGRRINLLLLNEGGVLVDRTDPLATAADVHGDLGFLTPTDDRDIALADLDGDGWLDIVTSPALGDDDPKHISHPRIYMNLGRNAAGTWLGFRYEADRIPMMHPVAGPRFGAVAVGDLTGDGAPDLYFADYDSGGGQLFDYNNRLLINDGQGFFADQTTSRLTAQMSLSAFGASAVIADMNGDGFNDIVKQSAQSSPQHVAVTYNDSALPGFFFDYDIVNQQSPYHVAVGDLNGDGMLDMLAVDDFTDLYHLNVGNDANGRALFLTEALDDPEYSFGGNGYIADLDNDARNDVVVADVHVDIAGCYRSMYMLRNIGSPPDVGFDDVSDLIPASEREGVFDVALMDVDGDGWKDMVLGRCVGMRVWMAHPPTGLAFTYEEGLPTTAPSGVPIEFTVRVESIGPVIVDPGSARLHLSTNGSAFEAWPLAFLGDDLYHVALPAGECLDRYAFYLSVETMSGLTCTNPGAAPGTTYSVIVADETEVTLVDQIEGDVSDWTIENSPELVTGAWQVADPTGTLFNGHVAAPDADATEGEGMVMAFVTENAEAGAAAGSADVDEGPTCLISPGIDLSGMQAVISYARWVFSDGGGSHVPDLLVVDISNDGGVTWVPVPAHTTDHTGSAWERVSLVVEEYVEPTANVQVRYCILDSPNDSITEAGIDDFQVEVFSCGTSCTTDLDGDGTTGVTDLVALLLAWGTDDPAADVNGSGSVDVDDLVELVLGWGACG